MVNQSPGGGRWVDVGPERFTAWVSSFEQRHGRTLADAGPDVLLLTAADGAAAECHVPFPPMPAGSRAAGPAAAYARAAAAHAAAARTVGVLLVRLGGYAAGVFAGAPPELIASKTGARQVHGRSAAGGWSQQRFARRREKQAAEALSAAADAADRVLGAYRAELDAVVLGGDKRTAAALRDDPRLRPYLAIAAERFITVPDPRLPVLRDSPRLFRAIRIWLTEPRSVPPGR
ncbi:MAG TPA: acVLRF1 family peptidyl-tRNA hydrolase [Streptosporangiaceae bacterium]|nr:acVLRF1 family peptidyl-tRNA hydrolase [Streptosporangiaceae bacterium]